MMDEKMIREVVADSSRKLVEIKTSRHFDPSTRARLLESEMEAVLHVVGSWLDAQEEKRKKKEEALEFVQEGFFANNHWALGLGLYLEVPNEN